MFLLCRLVAVASVVAVVVLLLLLCCGVGLLLHCCTVCTTVVDCCCCCCCCDVVVDACITWSVFTPIVSLTVHALPVNMVPVRTGGVFLCTVGLIRNSGVVAGGGGISYVRVGLIPKTA